jgi:hypothetical protein
MVRLAILVAGIIGGFLIGWVAYPIIMDHLAGVSGMAVIPGQAKLAALLALH